MSKESQELHDETLVFLMTKVAHLPIESTEATAAMKNLKIFAECQPLLPPPEAEVPDVPTTFWSRSKAAVAAAWDNETTRVLIKTGGTFAGVALVAYSTIKRDHVLERQALAQANQRPTA